METNSNRNNSRTFALGLIGGLGLAAALGAGFMLGGRGSESAQTGDSGAALRAYATATSGDAASSTDNQAAQTIDQDGVPQPPTNGDAPSTEPTADSPALDPTPTPVVEEPEPDEPEVTPTSTPGCTFCGSGDIAIAPTATPDPDPEPCPFCVDAVIGTLIDVMPPTISNVNTSFCYPVFVVTLEVDAPAEVWFEYTYDGNTYESIHKDVDNETFLPEDLGGFGWGVYFIDNVEIHAIDLSGNHAVADVAMPDPDLVC